MDALDVEMSLAEGEQALQTLLKFARKEAGTHEAHEAEKGLFTRLLPMGLAAMKLYIAQRGTGDVGPAVTRGDGMILPREQKLRGRDYFSLFGKFAVARTCYRRPGEPGIFPLDAQVNLPERGDSYVLQEWMTVFAVEEPFKDSAGLFEQLFDLDLAESVLMEVAQEAPEDSEGFYAQRPVPQADTEAELLVVSFDGKGVPKLKAEAAKRKAQLGKAKSGSRRKKRWEGSVLPSMPNHELPKRWQNSWWIRKREAVGDEAPRAQQVRRLASLVRTKQAVMDGIKADAERRAPQHRTPLVVPLDGALGLWRLAPKLCREWRRVTCVLDIMPVVGDLWSAANAWFGEGSKAGTRWVQQKLTEMLRGRVGYVIGGLRQLLTKRQLRRSVRETRANVITCFQNHRRWMHDDVYLAAGLPVGTGFVNISQRSYPYTDHSCLSYGCRHGIIEPCRRCRQVTVSGRGRERKFMPTSILPPRL